MSLRPLEEKTHWPFPHRTDGTGLVRSWTVLIRELAGWCRGAALRINTLLEHRLERTATAVDLTLTHARHRVIGVTDTSVARTITIAAGAAINTQHAIKDESGAAGTNNITLARSGSETIDGATTAVIGANFGSIRIYKATATAWFTW